MDRDEKAREARVLRTARRCGLVLQRNRARDPNTPGYRTYALVRIGTRWPVAGDLSIEAVEAYLKEVQ